jgi:DNA-binding transcriptional ArsR family regulator
MAETAPLSYQIDDRFIIDNLETLKVIADPLRKRILELLGKPNTVKGLAKQLNTTASKLYYHVNLLEEHGLIRVVDTRIVSGIIEKQYLVSARMFMVKSGLLSPTEDGDQHLSGILSDMFEDVKEEIRDSVRYGVISFGENAPKHRKLHISFISAQLTEDQAQEFYNRLEQMIREFNEIDNGEHDDQQLYTFQYTIFPTYRPESNTETADDEE